jgi:hypothetical protein
MQFSQDDRRALIDRVERLAGGSTVSRATIASAVDRVLAGLVPHDESQEGETILVALSAASMPDLGSRVRQGLAREGVPAAEMGVATVGRHTVVTLRAPARAGALVSRLAAELGASLVPVAGGAA